MMVSKVIILVLSAFVLDVAFAASIAKTKRAPGMLWIFLFLIEEVCWCVWLLARGQII